jgi:hypothetical protein
MSVSCCSRSDSGIGRLCYIENEWLLFLRYDIIIEMIKLPAPRQR